MSKEDKSAETSANVRLDELNENSYNPRRSFDDDAMGRLRDSIEENGLIQALTVRPVNGGYEVISGTRRLRALRGLFDDEHDVPVTVRSDVDDKQAKLMALAENLEREDLTNMEEAHAFAEHVTLELDGRRLSYAEYIGNLTELVQEYPLQKPSHENDDIEALAESLGRSSKYVSERLHFLTLPDEVQEGIDAGAVPVRKARMLARLGRNWDSFAARQRAISSLHEEYQKEDGLNNDDYDALNDAIKSQEAHYERLKEISEHRIDEFEGLVEKRKQRLRDVIAETVDLLVDEYDNAVNVAREPDDVEYAYEQLKNRLEDIKEQLHEKGHHYQELKSDIDREHTRREQAIHAMAQHDVDGECPYCGSDVTIDEVRGEVQALEENIDELDAKENECWSKKSALREQASTLFDAKDSLEQAEVRLEEVREEAQDIAGEMYE